ncbi:MAG: hypothetical protein ACI9IV_002277 [Paracoccaceae bacterium]
MKSPTLNLFLLHGRVSEIVDIVLPGCMQMFEFVLLFFRWFWLFAAQFSLARAMAIRLRVRMRVTSGSNSANVARMAGG